MRQYYVTDDCPGVKPGTYWYIGDHYTVNHRTDGPAIEYADGNTHGLSHPINDFITFLMIFAKINPT